MERGLSSPMMLLRFEWPGHIHFPDAGAQQGDIFYSASAVESIFHVSSGLQEHPCPLVSSVGCVGRIIHPSEYLLGACLCQGQCGNLLELPFPSCIQPIAYFPNEALLHTS